MTMTSNEREILKGNLETLDRIEAALGDLPHKMAVPAAHDIQELRDMLCEALPGGLFAHCESCGMPIGCEEDHATDSDGDGTFCGDCVKRWQAAA